MCNRHHHHHHHPHSRDIDLKGDLRVGGRAVFQQPALFKRDVKVEGRLEYRHLQGHDRGLFASSEELAKAVPAPRKGDWALVGLSERPQLWVCKTEGKWENSAVTTGLSLSFNLDASDVAQDLVNGFGQRINGFDQRISSLEELLSNANEDNRPKVIRLSQILDEAPRVETVSLAVKSATATYGYAWDNSRKVLLLQVSDSEYIHATDTYTYYQSWNDKPTGLASDDIDRFGDFFYLTSDTLLTLLHWSPKKGNLVPTASSTIPTDNSGYSTPTENPDSSDIPTADYDYTADPQYPEHYGAKGDGIAYYDWPMACFGGTIDENVSIEAAESGIEVYAPAERIYYQYGLTEDYSGKSLDYTSKDVVYSSVHGKFLLLANGKYYDRWANAATWNDPATGQPRTDTVFSDIRELTVAEKGTLDPNDNYGLAVRKTYVLRTGEGLVDIDDTMTDDGQALSDWFNANKGAGKVARLAPGRIYYFKGNSSGGFTTSGNSVMFKVTSGTTVAGNGAVLFPRLPGQGWPPKRVPPHDKNTGSIVVFQLNNAKEVSIKSVAFAALKDRDGNCPTGSNSRFSSSSSNTVAIASGVDATSDVLISDIRCTNIGGPISFSRGTRFTIEHVRATGVVNNGFGLTHSTYEDVHLEMAPYIGSGMHLFYGGCYTNEVTVRNSSFEAPDPYTEVLITFHGGSTNNAPVTGTTHNVYFENCTFAGGGSIVRGDNYSAGRCWIRFSRCSFIKKFDKFISALNWNNSNYAVLVKRSSWAFEDCTVNIRNGYFIEKGSPCYKVVLTGTTVLSTRSSATNYYLVGGASAYPGEVEVSDFHSNYPGPLGFTLPDDGSSQTASPSADTELIDTIGEMRSDIQRISDSVENISDSVGTLTDILNGTDEDVPSLAEAPDNPAVGYKYRNTTDGKTYECTQAGRATKLAVQLNTAFAGVLPENGRQTLVFNADEQVVFDFTGATSLEDVQSIITSTCAAAGYVNRSIPVAAYQPGSFTLYASGASKYLIITSKQPGNFENTVAITPEGSSDAGSYPMWRLRQWSTTNAYDSYKGLDVLWAETIGATGLVQLVSSIAERLTALENQTRYIGQKTLTAEELEEAGISGNQDNGGTEHVG